MLNKIFVSLFFVGFIQKAPGTFGSAVALVFGFVFLKYFSLGIFTIATFLIFFVAINFINAYQKQTGIQDPKEVVIDELVGMWVTLSIVPFGSLEFILAFVFFRGFDIYKPSIIGRVDKKYKNAFGVLLDDVLAGFFAGLCVLLTLKIISEIGAYL